MSRWFRLDDDVINDPKILLLPEAMRWIWVALLCIASKNGGEMPKIEIIALSLRVKPTKAAEYLTRLVGAGLIDKTETGFAPHNWAGRQYKSDATDPTAPSRQKAYRERNKTRNGHRNAIVTDTDTREQIQSTETEKNSEAKASGADAPRDPRSRLFDEGLSKIAALTGKGPDSCRSFIGKCLKAASDDASVVLGLIDDAERNRVVDAPAWISARLKEPRAVTSQKITIDEAITQFARFGSWSRHAPVSDVSQAPPELLAKFGLLPDGRKIEMEMSK